MEETEDIALGQSAPSEPVTSADPVEETTPVDYSQFTKKDFVDYLKELVREPDLKKVDQALREVKLLFGNLQDSERNQALQRFVDNGGSPDDFEFRTDAWDAAFESNFRVLRERRAEHTRHQEELKQDNFKRKNELLEELRKLVDGEDNKKSFDTFKHIQQHWKAIGPVPVAQMKTIWASYQALVDRFYDNRSIYFELKELDRKKNLAAKLELCARAEKLLTLPRIGEAVRELNELHEEYRHVGPVPREDKDVLWERFKKASDAVYERRDTIVAAQHLEWTENLKKKEEIIAEALTFASFTSEQMKEWNKKTQELTALQQRWEAVGPVPRNQSKDINKKFWSAFKTFYSNKGKFFKKLDEGRQESLKAKQELIARALELQKSEDQAKAVQEVKNLQAKWKELGPVPDRLREKIFQEFKTACDFFFERRRTQMEESDKAQQENLKLKEALIVQAEAAAQNGGATLEQIKEWNRQFHAIGFVPKGAAGGVRDRFSHATNQLLERLQGTAEEKEKAVFEFQLESLKNDPDAGQKIFQREQGIRKRIAKAENEAATLRNNLEFFARSKNADGLRAEVNQKIEAAEKEVAALKKQLKVLREATR